MKKNDGKLLGTAVVLQVLTFIISLVKVKILTNLLTVDDYGIYSILINTMGFLIFAVFFGLDRYIIKVTDKYKRQEMYKFLCLLLSLFSLLTLIITMILKSKIDIAIILFMISTILLGISQVNRFYIYADDEIERYNYLGFFMNNAWVVILIIYYFIKKPIDLSLNALFIFMIIGNIFSIIYSLKTISLKIFKVEIHKQTLITGLKYSIPLLPMVYANYILRLADKYTLMFLASNEELANYNVALSIMNIVVAFVTVCIEVYRPRIIQDRDIKNSREYITNSINLVLLISLPAIIMTLFFSENIVSLISNNSYGIASRIMAITTILGFCISICSINVTVAEKKGDSKLIFRAYVFGTVINILLNVVLVYLLGCYGAVIAGIISYSLIFYIIARRNNFIKYIILEKIIPLIKANVVFMMVVFIFKIINMNFILKSILLCIVYCLLLLYFNKQMIMDFLITGKKKSV